MPPSPAPIRKPTTYTAAASAVRNGTAGKNRRTSARCGPALARALATRPAAWCNHAATMALRPGRVEGDTRSWLEDALHAGVAGSLDPGRQVYDADGRPRHVTPAHFGRLLRKLK